MHDTDSLLSNITGSKDYVKELEKLVGNMETIDQAFFDENFKKVVEADKVLRSILKNTPCEKSKEFFTLSINSRLNNPYDSIKKKSKKSGKEKIKKVLADELRPRNMIKSPYFKICKQVEKKCNDLIESYNIDINNPSITSVAEVLKTNPELMDVKNLFGHKLENDTDVKKVIDLQKAAKEIISMYMLPLYDVRRTMDKNWGLISNLFNNMASDISTTEVKEILYLFIVAKYRCTITDNDKYYMKLFMSVINKSEEKQAETKEKEATSEEGEEKPKKQPNASEIIGKMDPARFLELLDTINLDQIDKKQNVYKFAVQSKEIIKRIVNKKEGEKMEDIMKDVQGILQNMQKGEEETEKPPETIEAEEQITDNADILKDI